MRVVFYVSMFSVHNAKRKQVMEIPDEELEGLEEAQRANVIDEYLQDWLPNEIDYGWYKEGDE